MKTLAISIALLSLAAGPALAEPAPCFPHADIVAALDAQAHEAPVARMLSDRGFVIEVLATADGSTFTILAVRPDGTACALAVGEDFALVPAAAPGRAS
jgi:hypothetical protein